MNESSTWQALRAGPRTLTISSPFGPQSLIFSFVQANWPGWESIFFTSSLAPGP